MERRDRTHRLIELGGLVQKSGLADLLLDDRTALYGALLGLSDQLQADGPPLAQLWRRRGQRAFEDEAAAKAASAGAAVQGSSS